MTKEESEKVEREFRYWGARKKARKVAYLNLEDVLCAGMTRDEIWEKAGIEDGDDV